MRAKLESIAGGAAGAQREEITTTMGRAVLIIEDEVSLARNLSTYLQRFEYDVHVAGSGLEGLAEIDRFRPEVILLDYNLPGIDGLETLSRIRKADPQVQVVMMTGHGNVELAVSAMKAGAADYLTKPLALSELKLLLERLFSQSRLAGTLDYYTQREAHDSGLDKIIGESAPMQELRKTVRLVLESERRLADAEPPAVLIIGETGSGKELVARALHFDGLRREQPFIELNCGAMPAQLIEAELFGYEKGAFTGAQARKPGLIETAEGGTVFLDEIGEAEPSTQVKLLKLLEEKRVRRLGGLREQRVNVRIISATHRSLEKMIETGQFRSDLFFRMRIVEVRVPPLRERGSDILLLARHFLQVHGARYRKPGLRFAPDAEEALLKHTWPGNVRELRNMIEQVVLMTTGTVVGRSGLSFVAPRAADVPVPNSGADELNLEKIERNAITRALEATNDNVTHAARLLGITRDALRYRLEKLDLRARSASGTDGE